MYKSKPTATKATRGTLKYATPYLKPPTETTGTTGTPPKGKPAIFKHEPDVSPTLRKGP